MLAGLGRRSTLVLVLVFLSAAGDAAAQNPTFAIEGVVADAQQALLPGATR